MKLLRLFALILAFGLTQAAYAQQEVDPDHFDSPAAHSVAHGQHLSAQHRQKQHVHLASKHGGKLHHRHAHTSA